MLDLYIYIYIYVQRKVQISIRTELYMQALSHYSKRPTNVFDATGQPGDVCEIALAGWKVVPNSGLLGGLQLAYPYQWAYLGPFIIGIGSLDELDCEPT